MPNLKMLNNIAVEADDLPQTEPSADSEQLGGATSKPIQCEESMEVSTRRLISEPTPLDG